MPENFRQFSIGAFRCTVIPDSDQGHRNVLLVDTPDCRVLLDPGAGREYRPEPGRLVDHLEAADIDPASIDHVMFSHGDFDHLGGAIDDGRASFPNARYFMTRAEFEFWRGEPDRLRPSPLYDEELRAWVNCAPPVAIKQLGPRLELVEFDRDAVPGFTMLAAPGHTPGNSVIRIASGNERLICVADLFYHAENIEDPDWVSQYDYDASQVVMTRRRILSQCSAEGALLMVYHMPFPGLGRVSAHGKGWRWTPWDR